jgi:hypothetical protein
VRSAADRRGDTRAGAPAGAREPCGCRKVDQAAISYSWMSPPRRSRRPLQSLLDAPAPRGAARSAAAGLVAACTPATFDSAILQALPHLEPGRRVSREAEKRMTSRELAHAWHTEPCPHEALRLSRRPTNGRRTLRERGADLNWAGYDDLKPLDAGRRSNQAGWWKWRNARVPGREGGHLAVIGAYVASGLVGSFRRSASSEISSSIDPMYP